jgi:alpha-D-xyloside xylohydrolase
MLKRLKTKGLHISVWINPYVGQNTQMFREGKENGYFIKNIDETVWQTDLWEPGLAIVDFTNPAACKWYSGKLVKLLETGVDCFKTDFGERIPTQGVRYFDGADPEKMHNYFTYIYNKTVFETINAKGNDAVVFARSATTGCQKFPVHWGGDCTANYQSMAETLRGGLSLGMGGFGFWSHDIGGFESTATPDLYKRWAAFGLLSSHSRLHGSSSYRVPWLFDEESVDVVRHFSKLKCSLMPYVYAAANEAAKTGVPVMRAMIVEFENDPACKHLDQQYMLGESLLVAPIFNDKCEATYYLPHGQWVNFFTGEIVNGGCFKCEKYDYMSLPLFIRENRIVAIGAHDDRPDYDYAQGVQLKISTLCEGKKATALVFDTDGKIELEVSALLENGSVNITACGEDKPWNALLIGVKSAQSAGGATLTMQDGNLLVTPDKFVTTVTVKL